jgi:A/G-specific adenine glycosylase
MIDINYAKRDFTKKLLQWNRHSNNRSMPWKGESDPYKIWLSEIILQQTRVEQGLDYYNRFVKTFPTVKKLANAPEDIVFKLWEGLGYYSRCKNLIATAKIIANHYNGKFPDSYDKILALKGVGPYTAAAIASFAFNLPYAVVDGNVFRVLARYFGNATAIDTTAGKHLFTSLANELLHKKQPGIYNQTLMDFGAVVCKPQAPLCKNCVLQKSCVAFAQNKVAVLPVKEKKIVVKERWFYYIVATYNNQILVKKRGAGDIWENLYEFVLEEKMQPVDFDKLRKLPVLRAIAGNNKPDVQWVSGKYSQKLTHQTIHGHFIALQLHQKPAVNGYQLVNKNILHSLPFPKFITSYLKDKNVSLNLV